MSIVFSSSLRLAQAKQQLVRTWLCRLSPATLFYAIRPTIDDPYPEGLCGCITGCFAVLHPRVESHHPRSPHTLGILMSVPGLHATQRYIHRNLLVRLMQHLAGKGTTHLVSNHSHQQIDRLCSFWNLNSMLPCLLSEGTRRGAPRAVVRGAPQAVVRRHRGRSKRM